MEIRDKKALMIYVMRHSSTQKSNIQNADLLYFLYSYHRNCFKIFKNHFIAMYSKLLQFLICIYKSKLSGHERKN